MKTTAVKQLLKKNVTITYCSFIYDNLLLLSSTVPKRSSLADLWGTQPNLE